MMTEEPVVVAEVAAPAIEAAATVVVEKESAVEGKLQKGKKKATKRNPPYFEMIKDAISSLKDKTGSSQYAIAKFIKQKQKNLSEKFKKVLSIQLKRLVTQDKLIKIKASYKLPTAIAPANKKTFTKPKSVKKKSPIKESATKHKPAHEAKAVVEPKVVAKPKRVTKAKVVAEPKVAAKSKRVTKAKVNAEPKITPKHKPVTKAKTMAKLAAKAKPKTPTRPTKVSKTLTRSTLGKKVASTQNSFRVTKRLSPQKVSSMIAKQPRKKAMLNNLKTKATTLKKSTTTKKTKK